MKNSLQRGKLSNELKDKGLTWAQAGKELNVCKERAYRLAFEYRRYVIHINDPARNNVPPNAKGPAR